jgi:hypothetical protein
MANAMGQNGHDVIWEGLTLDWPSKHGQ